MKKLTDLALGIATDAGATFADMRIVSRRNNAVAVARRSVKAINDSESLGYAVRVLIDGCWGFASSTDLDEQGVMDLVLRPGVKGM